MTAQPAAVPTTAIAHWSTILLSLTTPTATVAEDLRKPARVLMATGVVQKRKWAGLRPARR